MTSRIKERELERKIKDIKVYLELEAFDFKQITGPNKFGYSQYKNYFHKLLFHKKHGVVYLWKRL